MLQKLERFKMFYDIIMALLAIAIIASLIYQSRSNLSDRDLYLINQVDFSIWIVFVIDYVVRLILSKNKFKFIKENIIDLISILPLDAAFQGARAVRIVRVFYMFRVFVYLNRIYKRIGSIITTNDFHHVIWFTFSVIFIGAIAISYIDDMTIGDALWWSFVTTTTVGYGDIAPTSVGGRLVAVFLMLIGIGFLSTLTGNISSFFITHEHSEKNSYHDEVIQEITQKLDDFQSLSIDDLNSMHTILVALKEKEQ